MPQRRYFVAEDDPLGRLARKINIRSAITKGDVMLELCELVMDENKTLLGVFWKQSLIHSD